MHTRTSILAHFKQILCVQFMCVCVRDKRKIWLTNSNRFFDYVLSLLKKCCLMRFSLCCNYFFKRPLKNKLLQQKVKIFLSTSQLKLDHFIKLWLVIWPVLYCKFRINMTWFMSNQFIQFIILHLDVNKTLTRVQKKRTPST